MNSEENQNITEVVESIAEDNAKTEVSSEVVATKDIVAAKDIVVQEPSSEEPSSEEPSSEEDSAEEEKKADSQEDTDSQEDATENEETDDQVLEEKERHPDLAWYVVNAYSGYESKVKLALEDRIRSNGMEALFGEIQVPQETVVELVKGQKKTSNRKFFPGYVLVEMVLNQDTWHLVKETPKVSGFVGDKTNPVPLSLEEVKRILNQVEEGAASPSAKIKFEEGETVKVTDGPFSDFNGTVEEVNQHKGKLKVLISIFGRATPVELDFVQVEKLQKV